MIPVEGSQALTRQILSGVTSHRPGPMTILKTLILNRNIVVQYEHVIRMHVCTCV